jgi:HEPN domain-containing protein
MLDVGDAEAAGLFLQQAIEKYLKGWLLDHGRGLRRVHALHSLLDDAAGLTPSLAQFRPLCERVSGYYLLERYPHDDAGDGLDIAQVESDRSGARDLITALFPNEALT